MNIKQSYVSKFAKKWKGRNLIKEIRAEQQKADPTYRKLVVKHVCYEK